MQTLKDHLANRVKSVEVGQPPLKNNRPYIAKLKVAVADAVGDYLEAEGKLVGKTAVTQAIRELKDEEIFPRISHGRFVERQCNSALYNSSRFNSVTIGRACYFYTEKDQILGLL